MFVTNWISTTKIQKISEITNFFRHYFLSRTEVINSKAKKKGAHFEHLNYHLLSILIVVYHDLFSDAKVLEDII